MLAVDQWTTLEEFLLGQLDLAASTTSKTLRTLRFMEARGFPVDRPSIIAYNAFAAARKRDGARPHALAHCRKATKRLFLFHGQEPPQLRSPRVPRAEIRVLGDEVVRALMAYDVDDQEVDDDVAELELEALRFSYTFGFYVALRPPSEHVAVQEKDFDRDTGELHVYSTKTRRYDVLQLEPWLAEEVRDYQDGPRRRLASRGERALLVNAKQRSYGRGSRWTPENYRMWLWRRGREKFPRFRCYDMRHWGLTWRAIQWNLDVMLVMHWARHTEISNTMRYIHVAAAVLRKRAAATTIQPLAAAIMT